MSDLRVLVIASDSLARAGLAAVLDREAGFNVIGQVAGGADLSDTRDVYKPDVAVWDLGWDPLAALELMADLQEAGLPVVALLPDETYTAEAWSSGARGLLLRDSDAQALAAALTAVALGLIVIDPGLSASVPPAIKRAPPPLISDLTPREHEVLKLLAEGLPNKSIAQSLAISEHTVKFHVNAILGKLGAQSRTEAVTRATRLGLVLM